MITALLITGIPTLLFSMLLPKIGINPKSHSLRIAFAWFAGLYFFSFFAFAFSLLYTLFLSHVLVYAVYTTLIMMQLAFFFLWDDIPNAVRKMIHHIKNISFQSVLLILFCLLFSFIFYIPHLQTINEHIYTSPIYWDFHWHVGIIQNFVYGDNFPPQNESFAGIPMVYHFFTDFIFAMYSIGGLDLTTAVTYCSILFFFFFLIGIIGICEEFFASKFTGFLAIILTITSSSLHYIYYLYENTNLPLYKILENIFTNTIHPWKMSFIPGNPFNYTGVMFNLFYYVEERHVALGILFLLCSLWIIYHRNTFTFTKLLLFGIGMGMFFFWHIFAPLILIIILFSLLLFDNYKKQTGVLLAGLLCTYVLQVGLIKYITMSYPVFNTAMTHYPQLHFQFAAERPLVSIDDYLTSVFGYFFYGYGIKMIIIPLAFFAIYKKYKRLSILFMSGTIPLFIMINTLQISPNGTSENHKLLLPMTVFFNITIAYFLSFYFFKKYKISSILYGLIILLMLTLSGIIELMPFLNSKPTKFYADTSQSSVTNVIRAITPPDAVFVGSEKIEIHLAGRKLFSGDSAGPSDSINMTERKKIITKLYIAKEKNAFCTIANNNKITHIILHDIDIPYKYLHTSLNYTAAINRNNQTVFITDIKRTCNE